MFAFLEPRARDEMLEMIAGMVQTTIQGAYPEERIERRGRGEMYEVYVRQLETVGMPWWKTLVNGYRPQQVARVLVTTKEDQFPRTSQGFQWVNLDLFIFNHDLWSYLERQELDWRNKISKASRGMMQLGDCKILDRYSQPRY